MMLRKLLCILGPCLLLAGCHGPIGLAWRTVVVEPLLYCPSKDMKAMHCHHYQLATDAWKEIVDSQPGDSYSPDYACGFKDGFADYLDAGGTGEPPALPPRRYWHCSYRTPDGHQAIDDWFAGFRYGAACAKESGLRHFAVIPSSVIMSQPGFPYAPQMHAAPLQEEVPPPSPSVRGSFPTNTSSQPGSAQPVPQPRDQQAPMPPGPMEKS